MQKNLRKIKHVKMHRMMTKTEGMVQEVTVQLETDHKAEAIRIKKQRKVKIILEKEDNHQIQILQKMLRNQRMKQRKPQIKHKKMQILVKDPKRMPMLQKMPLKMLKTLQIELKMLLIKVIKKEKQKPPKTPKMLLIKLNN